jgi:hypothetical protein
MRTRQLCLFDGDRPTWSLLETSTREELLRLVAELVIEAAQRRLAGRAEEVASDERQDHA